MAPIALEIACRHNGFEAAHELSDVGERIERVPMEGTLDAVELLKRDVAEEIERIAGGVYWDIEVGVIETGDGARGSVTTPKSKPHRIEPTKPHGLLVFEKGGETIFVHGGIDHPGSKPVNWTPGVSARSSQHIRAIYEEKLRRTLGAGNLAMPVGAL